MFAHAERTRRRCRKKKTISLGQEFRRGRNADSFGGRGYGGLQLLRFQKQNTRWQCNAPGGHCAAAFQRARRFCCPEVIFSQSCSYTSVVVLYLSDGNAIEVRLGPIVCDIQTVVTLLIKV